MNVDCIEIGKPYIVLENGFAKLESEIKYLGHGSCIKTQSLFYKVPEKYEPYLCTERIDAFLVALIPKAMQLSAEIQGKLVVKSFSPISEKLE